MPFVGAGLIQVAVSHESLGGFIFAITACLVLLFVGVVVSIFGIARREKCFALSWIALFINAPPLIFLYLANFTNLI